MYAYMYVSMCVCVRIYVCIYLHTDTLINLATTTAVTASLFGWKFQVLSWSLDLVSNCFLSFSPQAVSRRAAGIVKVAHVCCVCVFFLCYIRKPFVSIVCFVENLL